MRGIREGLTCVNTQLSILLRITWQIISVFGRFCRYHKKRNIEKMVLTVTHYNFLKNVEVNGKIRSSLVLVT